MCQAYFLYVMLNNLKFSRDQFSCDPRFCASSSYFLTRFLNGFRYLFWSLVSFSPRLELMSFTIILYNLGPLKKMLFCWQVNLIFGVLKYSVARRGCNAVTFAAFDSVIKFNNRRG